MAKTIGQLEQAIELLEEFLIECEEDEVDNYKASLAQLRTFILESTQLKEKLDEVSANALVMALIL